MECGVRPLELSLSTTRPFSTSQHGDLKLKAKFFLSAEHPNETRHCMVFHFLKAEGKRSMLNITFLVVL